MKIECRGFFSYEVLKNPLRIGFSPRKPVFEPFVVVEIFIWKFFVWIYKLSSRKCKTKWSRAVRNGHITHFKRTLPLLKHYLPYSKQSLFKLIKSFKYQCPTLKFVGLSKAKSHLIKVSTDFAVVGVLNASYRCFGIHKSYRHAGCN